MLVGRVGNGRVAVFCCVRGHGRQRAWRTTVPPSRWTPFPFQPVHAWLVWCWPACVWSVYGHVAAAAVVWLVRGCRGRLMVGCVEAESRFCSWTWSSAGVAHHGVANPMNAVLISTRARLAGLVLAGLRVVCLRSSGGCSCGVVGARLSWPPHGQLDLRGFRRAAAGGRIAECCLCSRHVRVGAG